VSEKLFKLLDQAGIRLFVQECCEVIAALFSVVFIQPGEQFFVLRSQRYIKT
jgi:hypothetical protein